MSLLDVRNLYGAQTAFINNQAVAADAELVPAVTGYKIVVDLLVLSVGVAAATVFLESGATALTPEFNLGIGGNIVIPEPNIKTATSEALTLTSAGASSRTSAFVRYHLEQ